MDNSDSCLVCNSADLSFFLRCKDYLTGGEDFDLLKCGVCGFVFTKDPPGEAEIGKYYNTSEYISHSDTKNGLINILFHISRSLMLYRKNQIVRKASGLKNGSLLDIGCGTGYFAAFMKKKGWVVTGLEANEQARKFANEKFGIDVIGQDEIENLRKGQFDCITLWHVLEHLHHPLKYFTHINYLLKDTGICIVALPNTYSFDAKYFKNYWAAYDAPRHLWHFNPSSFAKFSEKAGFTVEAMKKLPLDVFYISILSERYKGSKFPFLSGLSKGFIFSIISLFVTNRSSSVIYLLTKNKYQ